MGVPMGKEKHVCVCVVCFGLLTSLTSLCYA